MESKQIVAEKNMAVDDAENSLKPHVNKEGKHDLVRKGLVGKRGKGKRRLSSDGGVSQEKKVARKSEDFSMSLPSEDQGLVADQSEKKSRKKRGREEDSDQGLEKVTKGRRLSTRLQKKMTVVESENTEDNLEQPDTTSNRKKRRQTSDHQKEVEGKSEPSIELDKPTDTPVAAKDGQSSLESFVNDTLWTDLYRPLHSTEVMANASAVSKLRSWLEEWKIKREKTLRKELQQQKR